jgi:hypothetical protein
VATKKIEVKVSGHEEVIRVMASLRAASRFVGRMRYAIQNPAPYTYFIEEGHYRNGRPGRRAAGPAHMMRQGHRRILQLLPGAVTKSLELGEAAIRHAVAGVMGEGTRTTKAHTPVVSGRLRGGFHTVNTTR